MYESLVLLLIIVVIILFGWDQHNKLKDLEYTVEHTPNDHVFDSASTYSSSTLLRATDITENGFVTYNGSTAGTFTFDTVSNLYVQLVAHEGTVKQFTIFNNSAAALTLSNSNDTGLKIPVTTIAIGTAARLSLIFTSPTTATLWS